ncbi:MAG: STAS domain-containing protein, partial [Pyrinomonadaceae bacterium]
QERRLARHAEETISKNLITSILPAILSRFVDLAQALPRHQAVAMMPVKITQIGKTVLKVEGRLTAADGEMLKQAVEAVENGERITIDVSGVSFIDSQVPLAVRHSLDRLRFCEQQNANKSGCLDFVMRRLDHRDLRITNKMLKVLCCKNLQLARSREF